LRDFAQSAGLSVLSLGVRGGWWQIIHVNDFYVSKWILRRGPLFEQRILGRVDREMFRDDGFATCFMSCRKPADPISP
jgi:hypothetical protein